MAASRIGIHYFGTALDFSSDTNADLVIVGSVAVDKKRRLHFHQMRVVLGDGRLSHVLLAAHRIGKGEGFSDLEFALLSKLGAVSPNATPSDLR